MTHGIDIDACLACGGAWQTIAGIEEPEAIETILTRLGEKALIGLPP